MKFEFQTLDSKTNTTYALKKFSSVQLAQHTVVFVDIV